MKRQQILPPPGRSSSPGPGGGHYRPVKTAALSELPSTPNNFFRLEESIGDMPLSQIGCSVDNKLTVDGHHKMGTRARGCSHLLALLARRRRIIDPGQYFTGGLPEARRGDIGAVFLQNRSPSTVLSPLQRTSPEAGFRGGIYGDNIIAQQSSLDVGSNPNEWSHSWAMRKPKINKNNILKIRNIRFYENFRSKNCRMLPVFDKLFGYFWRK